MNNDTLNQAVPEADNEMDIFMTGKHHDSPKRMPLYAPDGSKTEHYLDLVGEDSKLVRRKKKELHTAIAKHAKEGEFTEDDNDKFTVELLASAVVGWSFKKECTAENVCEFLMNSPSVKRSVDVFVANNENYFEKK